MCAWHIWVVNAVYIHVFKKYLLVLYVWTFCLDVCIYAAFVPEGQRCQISLTLVSYSEAVKNRVEGNSGRKGRLPLIAYNLPSGKLRQILNNNPEAGTEPETGEMLLQACPVCFLIELITAFPKESIASWCTGPSHNPYSREFPLDLSTGQFDGGNSSVKVPSSQGL